MLVNPDSLLNLPALGWQVIISCSRMRYFEPEGFELGRDLPMKPGRERSGCFFFFCGLNINSEPSKTPVRLWRYSCQVFSFYK